MFCSSTKQAERGNISGFCQQRAMVALGWLPRMAQSGHVSLCTHHEPSCQNGVAQPPLTLQHTQKKEAPWKCSHGGEEKPYYPATELHTFMSELNLSAQVTCTTSNQQHAPPSSSCMLSGRAWVKPTLARQSVLEMGCSYIQLHSRVTPRSHTTTTYLVHKVPSKVPTR